MKAVGAHSRRGVRRGRETEGPTGICAASLARSSLKREQKPKQSRSLSSCCCPFTWESSSSSSSSSSKESLIYWSNWSSESAINNGRKWRRRRQQRGRRRRWGGGGVHQHLGDHCHWIRGAEARSSGEGMSAALRPTLPLCIFSSLDMCLPAWSTSLYK
ncbi:hypothetical protein BHM03_00022976 [Ensete ventricosum]|nr:hypothetical protein BHM03_00022976 [Ensete ventricosum]